jgi:hypothetical protein
MNYVFPDGFYYNISGYERIYHIHNEKTGGTSLNYIFLSQGGESGEEVYSQMLKTKGWCVISNDKIFVGWNKFLIEKGYYFYAFSHIPTHMLKIPSNTFTVTCLRDPINRFISNYKEYLTYKTKNIKHPALKHRNKFYGGSFKDYMLSVPRKLLLGQLYMFSESFNIDEAYEKIRSCSYFFFTEQFSAGINDLSSKTGLPLKTIHARKSSIENNSISDEDKIILRELLEPEYFLMNKLKNAMEHSC